MLDEMNCHIFGIWKSRAFDIPKWKCIICQVISSSINLLFPKSDSHSSCVKVWMEQFFQGNVPLGHLLGEETDMFMYWHRSTIKKANDWALLTWLQILILNYFFFQKLLKTSANPKSAKKKKKAAEKAVATEGGEAPQLVEH